MELRSRQHAKNVATALCLALSFACIPSASGSVSPPSPHRAPLLSDSRARPWENDSIERFSQDVKKVLHVLRASEYGADPDVPGKRCSTVMPLM